jgi:hypothetical protein
MLSFILLAFVSQWESPHQYPSQQLEIDRVYIPTDFDDNDTPEFMVTLFLPNACYENPSLHLRTFKQSFGLSFHFSVIANVVPEHLCSKAKREQKSIPTVLRGELPKLQPSEAGYPLWHSLNTTEPVGRIRIRATEKDPSGSPVMVDDLPYAKVDTAFIEVNQLQSSQKSLVLVVTTMNTCDRVLLKADAIKETSENLVEVLPTVERFVGDNCVDEANQFLHVTPLPRSMTRAKKLYHIRSMGGASVNVWQ